MPPHPPSESQILTSYLLHPSPLPTILPLKSFLSLVPKSSAAHAGDLHRLYTDLSHQRASTIDDVSRRIGAECRRSSGLTALLSRQIAREEGNAARRRGGKDGKRNATKKRKRSSHANGAGEDVLSSPSPPSSDEVLTSNELILDTTLHSGIPLSNTTPYRTPSQNHTVTSLLHAIEKGAREIALEITELESSIETLATQCEDIVGNLSDLRYGRFSTGVEEDLVGALEELRGRVREVEKEEWKG